MSYHMSTFSMLLLVASGVCATVGAFVWLRGNLVARVSLALMLLSIAEWSLLTALEATAVGIPAKVALSKVQYIGITSCSVLLLTFALEYTRRQEWLTPLRRVLLWAVPILTLLLAATNEMHGLIWRSFTPSRVPGSNILIYNHGIAFYVATGYFYTTIIVSIALLVQAMRGQARPYQRQAMLMLASISVPWVANVIYVVGLGPEPGIDLTPLAFVVSGLGFAYAIYRYRLLDLVPVARDALVEHMADGVIVLDSQARIADLNQAARVLTGLPTQCVGRPLSSALVGEDAFVTACGGSRSHTEVQMRGRSIWLGVRSIELHEPHGRLSGRLVMIEDITARKQAEYELAVRMAELQERNQELDAFAHTVAHDLRNPLSQVLGFADLLHCAGRELDPSDTEIALLGIMRGSTKMQRIIEELLLLAQVRTAEVQCIPIDMDVSVRGALEALTSQLEESGAEVIVPPREAWPVVFGHPGWAELVWVNYLSNALKYGGKPPYIKLGAECLPDGQARFWVRDNGPGLTLSEQARLFTPFERLGQVSTTGYGLGLSIVRRIIEKLGGTVAVQSTPGAGSTFSFTLPLVS